MKIEDIIKLIDAGYTKEDIQAMNAPAPAPDENMSAMLQELKDLKKAVYAMNIMNTDVPAPKSVDDILAEAMKGGK